MQHSIAQVVVVLLQHSSAIGYSSGFKVGYSSAEVLDSFLSNVDASSVAAVMVSYISTIKFDILMRAPPLPHP